MQNTMIIKSISESTSMNLMHAVVEIAKSKKQAVSVAVMSKTGLLKGFTEMDGSASVFEIAKNKAYTALLFASKTTDVLKYASTTDLTHLHTLPNVVAVGGGVPIFVDGELVGSIGVSGLADPKANEELVLLALNKVGLTV